MQGDNTDATEILNGEDATSLRVDPVDAVTEVDFDSAAGTVVTNAPGTSYGKTRLRRLWIAAGSLSIALAILLVYYIANQQPAPSDTALPPVDAYREVLAQAESAIEQGEVRSLPALLLSHARAMPDNTDVEALLHDATLYRDMHYQLENRYLLQLAQTRRLQPFHTPLFEQSARLHIDTSLGAPATLQRLAAASEAWRNGELVEAITTVKQQQSEPANAEAAVMLLHYSKVVEDYETLSGRKADPVYTQNLLSFYLGLDPLQDRFFWGNLQGDFEPEEDLVVARASQQLQRAGRLWSGYHSHGGIDGATRQTVAGSGFRQRAEELAEAKSLVSEVTGTLYRLAEVEAESSLLLSRIDEEIRMQRDRLQMLLRFNDEDVLKDRLLMLPSVDAARR